MTDRPLTIGILIPGLRTDGGAEALVHMLIKELGQSPHSVRAVTLQEIRPEDHEQAKRNGATVVELPARVMWSPTRFRRLLRALRGVDVIHTHLVGANILGVIVGRLLRIPCVVTLHNAHTKSDRHWYRGRLETWLLRHGKVRVLAVGEHTASVRTPMIAPTPIRVLENAVAVASPIDAETRDRLRAEIMTDPSADLVITVGRLDPQKAQHDLIDAIGLLRSDGRKIECAIAGRGRLEAELQAQIDNGGLQSTVHLLGSRRDAKDLVAASDVFVLCSRWEGQPVALLEAMAAGVPAVTTGVGAMADMLADDRGIVTEVERPDLLGAAIGACLDDRGAAQRRAAAALALVDTRFSAARWTEKTIDHYRAAMADF